jgi:dolichyl-phosphate-mannose-protein mannosyltransferase
MQIGSVSSPGRAGVARQRRGTARSRIDVVPRWIVVILVVTVALRLVLVGTSLGHGYDHWTMQVWTKAMVKQPLSSFYALDLGVPQDHLPGDLLLFAGLGKALMIFSPSVADSNYPDPRIIKMVAVAADLAIGVMIYLIARRFMASRNALVATSLFLLSPGVMYVSSIWGQWDAVSAAFAVGALLLAMRGGGSTVLAWPVLAYACLIKPQYALIAPILLLFMWKRDGISGLVRSSAGIIAGLGVVQVVSWLFDIGLPGVPTRWSLIERMRASVDEYDAISLGAHNIWILPIGRGAPFSDQDVLLGGITYQVLGIGLFLLAAIVILWYAARFADLDAALAWGSMAMMFAMFITMTRMHERYSFPVLPLIVIAAVIMPRLRVAAVLLHLAYLLNVHVAYTNGSSGPGFLQNDHFYRLNGLFFIVLFAYVMWTGVREARETRTRVVAIRRPTLARA